MLYELLRTRWPRIGELCEFPGKPQLNYELLEQGDVTGLQVNGIQLSSMYDPRREAELQASRVGKHHTVVYLYGLGTGDLARVFLQRQNLQKLYIVILNIQLFQLVTEHFALDDIFTDERLELLLAEDCEQVQQPFSASPACLSLADDKSKPIADKVFLELSSEYNALRHRDSDSWIAKQLKENASLLESDQNVSRLLADKVEKLVVVGAGPSLEQSIAWIREHQTQCIIAVDAALKPLLQAGIIPDIVVAIDPSGDHVGQHLAVEPAAAKSIKLVYFPVVRNDVLLTWPGPRYAAYPNHPLYRDIVKRSPEGVLFASGSVIHPAIDLGVRLGAKTIYLAGADFAFSNDSTHAEGSSFKRDLSANDDLPGVYSQVMNGLGQRVKTQTSFLGYLSDLEDYIGQRPDTLFVNLSRVGARIKGTVYPDEL